MQKFVRLFIRSNSILCFNSSAQGRKSEVHVLDVDLGEGPTGPEITGECPHLLAATAVRGFSPSVGLL